MWNTLAAPLDGGEKRRILNRGSLRLIFFVIFVADFFLRFFEVLIFDGGDEGEKRSLNRGQLRLIFFVDFFVMFFWDFFYF